MVKKLFKYEIRYYLKTLVLIFPITLILGISSLVLSPLRKIDSPISLLYYFSLIPMYLGIVVSIMAPMVISVVRFYKNMYSNVGYLTFSLPASNHAHLITKLLTPAIFTVCGGLVSLITILISFSSLPEFWNTIAIFINSLFEIISEVNVVHIIFYGIEGLLLLIISIISSPLIYYSCISIGQLGKKNRILLSVLVYYVFTIIVQIVSSVVIVIFVFLGSFGIFDNIINFIQVHPYASMHLYLILSIIFSTIFSCLLYFLNYYIMSKKLNLE
ncbi:MAG: hypothetical protein MR270_01415 [Erysipelotrichaceae bacterium]|nr:hypothetical protein [Erysipelotrichaceae bacterium]